jgi:hypothetical protein
LSAARIEVRAEFKTGHPAARIAPGRSADAGPKYFLKQMLRWPFEVAASPRPPRPSRPAQLGAANFTSPGVGRIRR